jgi:mannan endo-1,4-beta-mannosidase
MWLMPQQSLPSPYRPQARSSRPRPQRGLSACGIIIAWVIVAVAAVALTTPSAADAATTKHTVAVPLANHIALGAFAAGYPGAGSQIAQFEQVLGSKVAIASSFRGWGDIFPDAPEEADAATGHTLLIAWDLGSTTATRFTTFTSHQHDAYLAQEVAAAKNFGAVFYIRPWAEMNADWSPFQPTASGSLPAGGTPAEFIAAWRYVVTYFRTHGATNVRWVFNPTTDTYAETTPVSTIWPGAAYVDVLGLDGYNWGNGGNLTWRSFTNIYTTQYNRLVALAGTLPVWICEIGSKEPAENDGAPVDPVDSKSTWYRQLLATTSMPNIKALVMFNVDKERDWRIESDASTLALMKSAARGARTSP